MNELNLHAEPNEGTWKLNATDQKIEQDWAGPLASVDEERIQYLRGRRAYIKAHDLPTNPVQKMGFTGSQRAPEDVAWRRREYSKETN